MNKYLKLSLECLFLYWLASDFYKYFKADQKLISILFLVALVFECIYLHDCYAKVFKSKNNPD